jgi:ArsR family transcriptional regulator
MHRYSRGVDDLKILQALADPTRLAIVKQLSADGEVCACDFTSCCDVSQPTVSHHLKVLRDAGLLTSERRASWVYYAVVPEALQDISALLNLDTDALAGVTA